MTLLLELALTALGVVALLYVAGAVGWLLDAWEWLVGR